MSRLGMHPRFGHMALRGSDLGAPELASLLASLLGERDVLRGSEVGTASVALRLQAVMEGGTRGRGEVGGAA